MSDYEDYDEEMDGYDSEYCASTSEGEDQTHVTSDDPVEWEYKILDLNTVLERMNAEADKLANIFQISAPAIRLLLRIFKWDSAKLCEKFYEYGDIDTFLEATVAMDFTSSLAEVKQDGMCDICCFEGHVRSLSCGHNACMDCWNSYINDKIKSQGSIDITCLGCKIALTDEQVTMLITDPDVMKLYQSFLSNAFVNSNRLLKWCPGANCQKVIELTSTAPQSIFCPCGDDICPSCNQGAHLPLSCKGARDWRDGKRRGVDNTDQWMDKYTRPCPKCFVAIQKEGGCNFMRCTNSACQGFFCWNCMVALKTCHEAHKCSEKFMEKEDVDETEFGEYQNSFLYHRKCEDMAKKDLAYFYKNIHPQMLQAGCSEIHLATVEEGSKILREGHRALAYLYGCMYYLKKHNEIGLLGIIEDNGKDLRAALTVLSEKLTPNNLRGLDFEAFVKGLGELRKDIFLAQRRSKAVLNCCNEAVERGLC